MFECYTTTAQLINFRQKKVKTNHVASISLGWIHTRKGCLKPKHLKRIKVLFDTGCDATLINKNIQPVNGTPKAECLKQTGQFALPEFHKNREIRWNMYVDESENLSRYDMTIGRDL